MAKLAANEAKTEAARQSERKRYRSDLARRVQIQDAPSAATANRGGMA